MADPLNDGYLYNGETKKRRKYSDREKAEALAVYDSCGNLTETAKITGIPDSTLSQWVNAKCGLNDDIPLLRDFKKLDLASKLETIAHQCAGLLPQRLPDANVREIVGAMGQSIEKSQLLRGKPTEINSNVQSNVIEQAILKRSKRTGENAEEIALSLIPNFADEPEFLDPELWGRFKYLLSKVDKVEGTM